MIILFFLTENQQQRNVREWLAADLPFSCFLRLRLLHILTAHIDKIMATIKNKIPPTTPAVIALCLTRAGTGNLTSSLDS
jgi:hypothetical protein